MNSSVGLTADVLAGAADYIEANGKHEGASYPYHPSTPDMPAPPACAIGALSITAQRIGEGLCDWHFDLYGPAIASLRLELGIKGGVAKWSDGSEDWEVVEVLRTTAKAVRHGDIEVA